ncbi:MAG TPA: hypothetical protein VK464_27350 [Symbiobacteriaceae bacterium]|nr:hypothetical protein [Symbiobacteriaceae bacterium]
MEPSRHDAASQRPACPRCGSTATVGNGSFARKDGTREARRCCRSCRRSFNQHTGTPLQYIKKRQQWREMTDRMADRLSLRRMAAVLRVHPSTAFRWRHRLLDSLRPHPTPILTGTVATSEAYVPYSEKGSRRTDGPGAWGRRRRPAVRQNQGPGRFRRVADGKPSFVLLATAGQQEAVTLAGRGRPTPAELHQALRPLLASGVEVEAVGLAPYAEACEQMSVRCAEAALPARRSVDQLRSRFYGWLHPFRGVATRYLPNYITWFSFLGRLTPRPSALPPCA